MNSRWMVWSSSQIPVELFDSANCNQITNVDIYVRPFVVEFHPTTKYNGGGEAAADIESRIQHNTTLLEHPPTPATNIHCAG